MLRVVLVAAIVTCTFGRERYEGWFKPNKPFNPDPLVWGGCSAECGGGTKYESSRPWTISCNNHPCDQPLACLCGNTDFLFVLDNTGSITQRKFFEAKQFIMDVLEGLSRFGGPMDRSRVALITFENYSYVEFDFNDGYTFADVPTLKNKIWEVEKQNGFTNTSGGLWVASEMLKSQQSSNKKVAIVMTDGHANIDAHLVEPYATELHDANVAVYVIGIGYTIDEAELRSIASKPEEKFYYYTELFSLLADFVGPLMNATCCDIPPPSCTLHSATVCSATCGGGRYDEVSSCQHYDYYEAMKRNETVVETLVCNTNPCPQDVLCSHDDHTHLSPGSWEETCRCNADGTTSCEEEEYDPHGDDQGETSRYLGCRWAKVWHDPGSQWIQDVSGSRVKNCSCSDPPPSRWHIWTYCEPICRFNDTWYYPHDEISFEDDNGVMVDCECKIYAKLQCKPRRVTNEIPTDPVLGCRWLGVWHGNGTTWTEYVSGGRMKECTCANPLPEFWNIDRDCIGKCRFEGAIYYEKDSTQWTNPDGDLMLCECTVNAQMQCSYIRS